VTQEPTPPTVPERPLLHGERVWLRPLEERDMRAYVAGMNDTEVGGMAGYKWPLSVPQATSWLERTNEDSKHGRGFFFAVCELGDDRFVGTVWLKGVNLIDGNAELAIFLDREHIGSGYGSDAQRAILDFAFLNLGLQRVWLTAYAANERAIHSYERLGFRHEGRLRQAWRGPRGLEDTVLMGILRDEWIQAGEGDKEAPETG
jgi:RimJ/RimL family protein N-acetyltransferase